MASSKEFKDFVLEQLRNLDSIVCRPIMGEFLLYFDGILFGGIYDDRLLVKITTSNQKYSLSKVVPYKNAKPMFEIDNLDDVEYLAQIIQNTCSDLQKKN